MTSARAPIARSAHPRALALRVTLRVPTAIDSIEARIRVLPRDPIRREMDGVPRGRRHRSDDDPAMRNYANDCTASAPRILLALIVSHLVDLARRPQSPRG